MYNQENLSSQANMKSISSLSPKPSKYIQKVNQSTPKTLVKQPTNIQYFDNFTSESSIDLSFDIGENSSKYSELIGIQSTFVDRQLIRNVFDYLQKCSRGNYFQLAHDSMEKITQEISELEFCNRRLVSENSRLAVLNNRSQIDLQSKERSLQDLNLKLNKIIERMEKHEQVADVGLLGQLSILLGRGQITDASKIKGKVEGLLSENRRLEQQVGYLQKLLMGKKESEENEMEKLIHKVSKTLMQRDSLQSKVRELQSENGTLKQNLKQKENQLQKSMSDLQLLQKSKNSETTNDTPQLTKRASQPESFLIASQQSYQVMLTKFSRIQQLNNALLRKIDQLNIHSESLKADLIKQLQEIQNMKTMSDVRQIEFENQIQIYEQEIHDYNKREEKALALLAMLESQANNRTLQIQVLTSKLILLEKQNTQLNNRFKSEALINPSKKINLQEKIAEYSVKLGDALKKIKALEESQQDLKANSEQSQSRTRSTIAVKDCQISQMTKELQKLRQVKKQKDIPTSEQIQTLQKQVKNLKKRLDEYEIIIVPQFIRELDIAQMKMREVQINKKSSQDQSNHEMDRIIMNLSRELERVKGSNSELNLKKSQLEIDLAEAKKQITANQATSPATSSHLNQWKEQRDQYKSIILQLEKQNSDYSNKIQQLEEELIEIKGAEKGEKVKKQVGDESLNFELSQESITIIHDKE